MAQFGGIGGLGAPINYYNMIPDFRGEALQETQNQLGQAQLQQYAAQQQQQQAAAAQQQAFQAELPSAINDPAKLQALAVKYPTQIGAIRDQMQFKDAQDVSAVSSATSDLQAAAQVGPEAVAQALVRHAGTVQQKGATPQQLMQMYVNDPTQFSNFIGTVKLGALSAKDQFGVQNDQQKNALTQRGQDLSAETARRGQDITMRGQNISAQNSAFDRQIRMAELQDKGLDRQIARETNLARLTDLQQKQAEAQQKAADAKQAKVQQAQQTYDTLNTALGTIADLKASPGLGKAVGLSSAFPTIPGSDAANFEATLDTFKAQTFLPMVQSMKGMGALSDAEGKKLTDAVGALSPKMSEAEFNRSLNRIEGQLRSKLATAQKTYGIPPQTAQPQAPAAQGGGYSNLWGD
ncbi:phage DNA ejection protein [Pantoea agglomerans]|uniref:phage DNA ejection protein n=1 Tax=Enterobacter agglomerans TaxID=549 RepID=UPI003DA01455